jgi:hypothetical protein
MLFFSKALSAGCMSLGVGLCLTWGASNGTWTG